MRQSSGNTKTINSSFVNNACGLTDWMGLRDPGVLDYASLRRPRAALLEGDHPWRKSIPSDRGACLGTRES